MIMIDYEILHLFPSNNEGHISRLFNHYLLSITRVKCADTEMRSTHLTPSTFTATHTRKLYDHFVYHHKDK